MACVVDSVGCVRNGFGIDPILTWLLSEKMNNNLCLATYYVCPNFLAESIKREYDMIWPNLP